VESPRPLLAARRKAQPAPSSADERRQLAADPPVASLPCYAQHRHSGGLPQVSWCLLTSHLAIRKLPLRKCARRAVHVRFAG